MEDKILETEVLEETPTEIPEELLVYLEKDDEVMGKLDGVISELENDIVSLNSEREESEIEFENRLNEFKEQLDREKEERFNEFYNREQDILNHKDEIERIKLEQQGKQVNYIDNLIGISNDYNSKINSIEEAINACVDNDSLLNALDEEKAKKDDSLNNEYNIRIEELNGVLEQIGEGVEPEPEEEPQYDEETNIDEEPTYEDTPVEEDNKDYEEESNDEVAPETNFNLFEESYDTEVVSHEPREDVINEIYASEDVMEGHVFPYLRSLK